jgi:hypothetical protein
MKHYSSEQWADYVCGTAPKRQGAEMKRHLGTGCKKCEQTAGMWMTVLNLAHKEAGYQPPDSAVRLAKSYFAMSRMEGKEFVVPRVARLIFDSFRQPQLAGVRSLGFLPRQCLYQSGPMLVDLWMEPASSSAPVALIGQILEQSKPSQGVEDMVVKVQGGDAEIAATKTNQFGEFHLKISPTTGPQVQLTIGDGNKIALVIPAALI